MPITITAQDLTQDSIKESFTKLGERAFSGAATYMNTLADSIFAQAATPEARAALFQQQLANLDNVATHVASVWCALRSDISTRVLRLHITFENEMVRRAPPCHLMYL